MLNWVYALLGMVFVTDAVLLGWLIYRVYKDESVKKCNVGWVIYRVYKIESVKEYNK